MSKQKTVLFLLCLLSLVLTACGGEEKHDTTWTTEQMAAAALDASGSGQEVNVIRDSEEQFAAYVDGYYRLGEAVEEGTILYAGGVSALEVAVFRLAEGADAPSAEQALQAYIEDREGAFTGYAPEEAAILEQSGTAVQGQYVALLICPDRQQAQAAFDAAFQGGDAPNIALPLKGSAPAAPQPAEVPTQAPAEVPEPTAPPAQPAQQPAQTPEPQAQTPAQPPAETPPPQEETPPPQPESWSYDSERLLAAWQAGEWEDLDEKDRAILDQCKAVIDALIKEGMSAYDQELAIHDWMIAWARYDDAMLDNHDSSQADPDNDNPYGLLIGRKGICLGYTSTFQLFMDMIGIECVIVNGTAHSGTDEHAWNMVKLDGDWYCVDVTWDDPITSSPFPLPATTTHRYFNVTSAFLRSQDHQWDESATEEAKGTAYAWDEY